MNSILDGPISSGVGSGSVSRATKVSEFTILCHPFHNGAITGVDVCQRKPIVVTCGVDKVQTDVLNTYKWFPLNVTHLSIYLLH